MIFYYSDGVYHMIGKDSHHLETSQLTRSQLTGFYTMTTSGKRFKIFDKKWKVWSFTMIHYTVNTFISSRECVKILFCLSKSSMRLFTTTLKFDSTISMPSGGGVICAGWSIDPLVRWSLWINYTMFNLLLLPTNCSSVRPFWGDWRLKG